MITIIALRTAMSALSILSVVVKWNVGGIVLYSLLALLTFWFTATCLAIIGDAKGHARFKGTIVVGYTPPSFSSPPVAPIVKTHSLVRRVFVSCHD